MFFVFFFKQKTAYEMRISDWSSDVCSSDLAGHGHDLGRRMAGKGRQSHPVRPAGRRKEPLGGSHRPATCPEWLARAVHPHVRAGPEASARSEEQTSELPSLMRISYAVFCLKKTTTKTIKHHTQ